MRNYLKYGVWDWVISTAIAGGLILNFYNGYNMTDKLSGNMPAVFLIAAAVQLIIVMFNSSAKGRRAGLIAGLVILAGSIIYNQIFHPFLHEKAFSAGVFWILMFLLNVIVFFMTRKQAGIFILFAGGNLVIATEVFLEFGLDRLGYLIFLVGCAAMIFWRVYLQGLVAAITARMQVRQYMLQIAGVCVSAMVISVLIFVLILGPLHLKTHELKLIEELQSMEIVHRIGTYSILPELNEQLISSNQANYNATSSQPPEDQDTQGTGEDETEAGDSKKEDKEYAQSQEQQEENTNQEHETPALAIRYDLRNFVPLFIILAAIGAIAGAIAVRRRMRKRFITNLHMMERKKATIILYNYFKKVLKLVKVQKQGSLTPMEFARSSRKYTSAFISGGYDFADLTKVYTKVLYGQKEVSDAEWNMFVYAYLDIHENVYEEVGKLKYALLFFRI